MTAIDSPLDERIPKERRSYLNAACRENVEAGKPPGDGVRFESRDEVDWMLDVVRRETSPSGPASEGRIRLPGASLREIDLSGLDFRHADLSGADLRQATLTGCRLTGANLQRARLSGANLSGARLNGCNLREAVLQGVNVRGTNLRDTDLRGADLEGARMDSDTQLAEIRLDGETSLADVLWNGAAMARVDWKQAPTLGDERETHAADAPLDAYRRAARAYHGLAVALRQQGLSDAASEYRLCEQRMERAALKRERRYGPWLFSSVLNIVSGYGERPGRALLAYLAVILLWTVLFFGVTHIWESAAQHLSPLEALILSISSFHGRGFLPSKVYGLDDPVAYVAAFEAVIGLFIEVVVIASFSRRFLED